MTSPSYLAALPVACPRRRVRRRLGAALGLAAALACSACGTTPTTPPGDSAGSTAGTPGAPATPSTGPGPSAVADVPGQLTRIGSLTVTRASHSASLLPDGRVIVAGGCTADSCEAITATTEIVDPRTGASVAGPEMLEARVGHAAVTLADGRILVIGGFGPASVTRTTELYDPEAGSFSRGPDLTEPRADPVAVILSDGSLLVAGGFDGRASVATAEILDPGATAFHATGPLGIERSSHAAALLSDGRVLVMGGSTGGPASEVLATAETYDPTTGTWSPTGEMSARRHKLAAIALEGGRVLVIGGSDERDGAGRYRSAELYDHVTGTFSETGSMAAPRYKISAAVVRLTDGRVLIAGGAPAAEVFEPTTGRFAGTGGDADADFSFATAVRTRDGTVIVLGGYDPTISLTDQVLRFVP